jgi:hypothetical protein
MKRDPAEISTHLAHLRGLPFVVEARATFRGRDHLGTDGEIIVRTNGGPKTLTYQIKRSHLTMENAASIQDQAKRIPRFLVLAPLVGRDLGELFVQEGVNYIDRVGNWYINLDDQYVALAQRRTHSRPPRREKGLGVAAYRVIYALLVEPGLIDQTTRLIAAKAGGLSPQTAANVRHSLVERGLALHTRAGYIWTPGRRRDVLDLWVAGFASTLWPALKIGTFRARTKDRVALEKELAPALKQLGAWRWGGAAAEDRLVNFYRGERTLVYLLEPALRDLTTLFHAVRDDGGNIVVARAPGPLALSGPLVDCAHPLLVYADLLVEGNDRTREAASVLRERLLKNIEEAP